MFIVLIDFFQTSSMGPSFSSLNTFINDIASATQVDIDEFTTLKEGMFWVVVIIFMAIVAIWTFCVVIYLTRLVIQYEN